MLPEDWDALYLLERWTILMEGILNVVHVFCDAYVDDLLCMCQLLHEVGEECVVSASYFYSRDSRALLPDVVVSLQRPRVLVLSDQLLLFFRPQVYHHLFRL